MKTDKATINEIERLFQEYEKKYALPRRMDI